MLNHSFMPLPNALTDALLRSRLSGGQWRLVMWALRNTLGWNRPSTPFTWYRIADALGVDRSGVLRSARSLIKQRLITAENGCLAVEVDPQIWRKAMTDVTGEVRHRKRCRPSPVFRRAIERFNGIKKEKRKKDAAPNAAGAARPIPDKYQHVSES